MENPVGWDPTWAGPSIRLLVADDLSLAISDTGGDGLGLQFPRDLPAFSNKSGVYPVWRAFFFAVGTMLVIVGVECLIIDSATIATDRPETMQVNNGWFQPAQTVQASARVIRPPEWIPWSFIATGTVVVLYALTLPRRWQGGKSSE